jgi:4-amino-4-deoxy-L-arabinose transferase-like glycosyltransferase
MTMGERVGEPAVRLRAALTDRSWRFWRSPEDEPSWARPALLAITAIAALSYAWGMNSAALEAFYGASARSMSMSWHNFFFAAFDPAGTVSLDKLPGGLWPQALSLRLFGFHTWAIVLPQVIEGTLTVLVLYRAIRRLAGALAGIVAAGVLATSPVTVALNRGNVADSLLILLLVLAADAISAALISGRLRTLLVGAVCVGLAFETKMTVAWLVAPALGAAYLLAAPSSLRSRLSYVALAGVLIAVVSVSWMTVVTLVPAHDRPYVDGTQNDSLFTQTFDYNGLARLRSSSQVFQGTGHPSQFIVRLAQSSTNPIHSVKPSWHRLLAGPFGRDDGWLLPAMLIASIAVLLERRRAGRRDPVRAAVVLWGLWLLVFGMFFSAGGYVNSYYVASLIPAIGALCGIGVAVGWRHRKSARTQIALGGALLTSVAYGIYLLRGGTGVPGWLTPLALCLGATGMLTLAASRRTGTLRAPTGGALTLILASSLFLPAVASTLIVIRGLGPAAAPYEPASATVSRAASRRDRHRSAEAIEQLDAAYETTIPLATESSTLAAPFILATGREILPIGGFQGGAPVPTLARLKRYIADGELRAFLVSKQSPDPRIRWINSHCTPLAGASSTSADETALYDCSSG